MVAIVVTGRGGAGKTTMTSNLSAYFSKLGYRVLAVDGDLYLPKLAFHFGIDNPAYNIHTLLKNPEMRTTDAIYHDQKTGVDVLPGSPSIYDILDVDPKRMRAVVREILPRYNFTVVDSPVGIPFDTISTFVLASHQLIIIEIGRSPIHSTYRMIENEILKLQALGEAYGLQVGVMINKVRESGQRLNDLVDFIEYSIDIPVLGVVPFDYKVPEASNHGIPVVAYDPRAKASKAIASTGDRMLEWILGRRKEGTLEKIYKRIMSLFGRKRIPAGKKF